MESENCDIANEYDGLFGQGKAQKLWDDMFSPEDHDTNKKKFNSPSGSMKDSKH